MAHLLKVHRPPWTAKNFFCEWVIPFRSFQTSLQNETVNSAGFKLESTEYMASILTTCPKIML